MSSSDDVLASDSRATARTSWIVAGLLAVVMLVGLLIWISLSASPPVDPNVAGDPTLERGSLIYQANCANCHGPLGHGDGPLSRTVSGPAPRDFRQEWKYGADAAQAFKIVREGAPDSTMPAWKSALSDDEIGAVTAYVFRLGGKPVPQSLRSR